MNMEKQRALKLLTEYPGGIDHLRRLRYGNDEYRLWKNKVSVVLEAAFGKASDERKEFHHSSGLSVFGSTEREWQNSYLYNLRMDAVAIKSILGKYEIVGISREHEPASKVAEPPKAFIAQGGETPALKKVCNFLSALGVKPLIVENEPSEGRSVNENVEYYLDQSDCAVILATKGDVDSKTKEFIPRGNILIEVGRCQERLPRKTVYLLEEGATLPSNINEKVWERFTQDCMDKAFIKVANELRAFGLIKAARIEQ